MLYHGTYIDGLDVIKANSKSHTTGKKVAYFTGDRCYALVCCRCRESNFVTMGLRADGKQHYYERFPEQLKKIYIGKKGFALPCSGQEKGCIGINRNIPEYLHDADKNHENRKFLLFPL